MLLSYTSCRRCSCTVAKPKCQITNIKILSIWPLVICCCAADVSSSHSNAKLIGIIVGVILAVLLMLLLCCALVYQRRKAYAAHQEAAAAQQKATADKSGPSEYVKGVNIMADSRGVAAGEQPGSPGHVSKMAKLGQMQFARTDPRAPFGASPKGQDQIRAIDVQVSATCCLYSQKQIGKALIALQQVCIYKYTDHRCCMGRHICPTDSVSSHHTMPQHWSNTCEPSKPGNSSGITGVSGLPFYSLALKGFA